MLTLAEVHEEMIQALIDDKRGFFTALCKAAGSEPEALETIGKDTIFVLPIRYKDFELPSYCEFSPYLDDSFGIWNGPKEMVH